MINCILFGRAGFKEDILSTFFEFGTTSVESYHQANVRYTAGLLDISVPVCYNTDNIRQGQPETGCCAEILFERSCRS